MPNDSTCIPDIGYFGSPDFLILSLHLTTAICTPVYLLGLYCILYKTPEVMKSVKYHLLALHFWAILLDYSLGVLGIPYMFFPEVAWISFGLLRYLGVSTAVQNILALGLICFMATSIMAIYENRFFILREFSWKHRWEVGRRFWHFAHYVLVVAMLIPVIFMIPDQETALKQVMKTLPCLPDYLYKEEIFVLATDLRPLILGAFLFIGLLVLETGFFIICIGFNAMEQVRTMRMSEATFQMQKRFFIALVIQTAIPFAMLLIPLIILGYIVVFNYRNQALVNIGTVYLATHGFFATIVMIVVHRPYRVAVKGMIEKIWPGRRSRVVAVIEPMSTVMATVSK